MSTLTENDWLSFIRQGREPVIRKCIFESWKNSVDSGIDPFSHPRKSSAEIPVEEEFDREFFGSIRPYVESAFRGMQTYRVAWLLCTAGGKIIETGSLNPEALGMTELLSFIPGISLSEEYSGTNAVSLTMESGKPAFCNGPEHFLKKLHECAGASAPVYDIDGSLKGFIALYARYPNFEGSNLLGVLLMLIQVLDRELRLKRMRESSDRLKGIISKLCSSDAEPMIMVSRTGFVEQINPAAVKLLGLSGDSLDEKNADKLASFTPMVREIAQNAIAVRNKEMRIRTSHRDLNVSYDKIPLYSEKDEFIGVIIVLHEKGENASRKKSQIPEARYSFPDIIGKTSSLLMAKELAMKAAETSVYVLLSGPSGTGKEMFAHSIHNASDRKSYPFITINCAAIPREIAESELFGYGSGAFTGAVKGGNVGKLEAAHRGTVFLDEIGEMPLELQSKLLRVLEEKTITRIGESSEIPVNIRFIAATNKDLSALCRTNKFREDLYYRLSVTSIQLPPLSECKEDIPDLVSSFINTFNEMMGKKVRGINPKIMESFMKYSWPGNIRELRNAIEFAVMMNSGEEIINWKDLPGQLRMELLYPAPGDIQMHDPLYQERQGIENSEKVLYMKAIKMAGGNMTKAAKILNVGRATLYRKIKKYDIKT